MIYRELGLTGWKVSVLSYGASSLGGVFHAIDENEGIRAVHTALELGINFIDVAPYYGATRAETVLGKALRGVPRDSYYLATKVGRYDLSEFDFFAARVASSVDESLHRLGVEHIDLIQCHDIEFGDLNQIVEETLPALRRLRDSGKVRYIGISGYPIKIFREVLQQTTVDTVLSYCHYALNDTSLTNLIPFLQQKQVGIINASPLSMGLLSGHVPPDWHPAPEPVKQACAAAAEFCDRHERDIAQLAIQFSVANPAISTTLVGTADPEEIRKNVQWAQEPPDEEFLREVQAMLQPIHNQTWPSGRPENNDP